jgi:hypothetical protein
MTNKENVLDLMESSEYGVIAEMAMIQIINVGLHSVLKGIDESEDPVWSFISKHAFKGAVQEIKDKFQIKYE